MSRVLTRPISCRHVVFPDLNRGQLASIPLSLPASRPPIARDKPEESLTPDEYDCIRWMFQRAGLHIDGYRGESIKRRVPACLRALRVDSLQAARAVIGRNSDLLNTAISALVIGVTGFFRDATVFDAIRHVVIPEILSQRHGPRIWSAGCSEGCELYSIAMLLAERGVLQRSIMVGTDCRADALARAKEGRYDAACLSHVPAHFLGEYFRAELSNWQIHLHMRSVIHWRVGNILAGCEPGEWDLVLCRNMAIYLQPRAASQLWDRISKCIRPGGFLVLGKAERPTGASGLTAVAPCIYRRERS